MGLLDVLLSIGGALLEEAEKKQTENYRKANNILKQYELKINQAEHSEAMNNPEKAKKIIEAREKIERTREYMKLKGFSSTSDGEMLIGGKTLKQWDSEWHSIGCLETANLTPYNNCVGLYRHVISGKTMYVGRAIELYNGGFRKRLSDYRRVSDSARIHTSGKIIHQNLSKITTYILIVGTTEEAVEITKKLEGFFIGLYHPEWNKMINI
jgi:IS1 family transposase